MTGEKFKKIQDRLGISNRWLADFWSCSIETIERYRKSKHRIPGAASRCLEALADGWRPKE